MFGAYPDRIDDGSLLNVQTGGRFIPTTSWEAVWNGLAEWFGVEETQMDHVLPNRGNFPASAMWTREQVFV